TSINTLFIVKVYQTNFDNISLNKQYLIDRVDGKSPVFESFVLLDEIDLEALKTSDDIHYSKSGFDTQEELEKHILTAMLRKILSFRRCEFELVANVTKFKVHYTLFFIACLILQSVINFTFIIT